MRANLIFFFISILLYNIVFLTENSYASTNENIIATVNNINISTTEFGRLYNAHKKQLHTSYDFDLFTLQNKNPQIAQKRKEQINQAKSEGLNITADELDESVNKLLTEYGTIENLEKKAKENNLTLQTIKTKLQENLLLDKYFEITIRDKITNHLINELLVIEEAKTRKLEVKEDDINKRLNFLKDKQGGESGFKTFLAENNATLEDAKNEIKNQLLYELTKEQIIKENKDFNDFIKGKKDSANIIIYNKIDTNPEQQTTPKTPTSSLRTNKYPVPTKQRVQGLNSIERGTSQVLAELEKKIKDLNKNIVKNEQKLATESPPKTEDTKEQNNTQNNNNQIELNKLSGPVILKPLQITDVKGQKTEDRIIELIAKDEELKEQKKEIKEFERKKREEEQLAKLEIQKAKRAKEAQLKELTRKKKEEIALAKAEQGKIKNLEKERKLNEERLAKLEEKNKKEIALKAAKEEREKLEALQQQKEKEEALAKAEQEKIKNLEKERKLNEERLAKLEEKNKKEIILKAAREEREKKEVALKTAKEKREKLEALQQQKEKEEALAKAEQEKIKNLERERKLNEERLAKLESEKAKQLLEEQTNKQEPLPSQILETVKPINPEPKYSVNLNDLNIFMTGKSNLQNVQGAEDKLKTLEELRKRIDERRLTTKQ